MKCNTKEKNKRLFNWSDLKDSKAKTKKLRKKVVEPKQESK